MKPNQLALMQIGCMLAPYFTNEKDKIPHSMDDIIEVASMLDVTIKKGDDLEIVRDKIKDAMTIYVNIDTDPDQDCYGGCAMVITNLWPPSDKPWSLEEKNEDDERVEQLLIRMFDGYREMEGVVGVQRSVMFGDPDMWEREITENCTNNNIVINKMGPRLAGCE
jgi:hypothetical protein